MTHNERAYRKAREAFGEAARALRSVDLELLENPSDVIMLDYIRNTATVSAQYCADHADAIARGDS